ASVTLHHPESAHPCTLSLHDALPICARFSFRPMSNTMTAPPQSRALEARAPKMVAYWVLLTIFLVVDVVTKQIAERTLLLHQPRPVIGDWVQFTLAYNRGAAFSMHVGDASRWVFSIIAVVVLFMLWRMLRESAPEDGLRGAALGMVSAGAVGNLLDRLRSERGVID